MLAVTVTVVMAIIIVWSALSRPLDRRGITPALFLMAVGFGVSAVAPDILDVSLETVVAERIAEIALVLLLFSDATRIDLRVLRNQLGWPTRLLLIGLPLSILAGTGIAALVFPGMALASAFLLAIMLAPTDAALGQKVVADSRVPSRVRQALDVESGLNDGLAVPLFLVALSIANAEYEAGVTGMVAGSMAAQIGWALTAGLVAAIPGGLLFRAADRRGWIAREWRQILPLAVALLAYAIAQDLGGSGFIAAFVGGIAFGRLAGPSRSKVTVLSEAAGDLLAAVTWIAFGALALTLALPYVTWQVFVYAVLSLTVVRMLPVAIALAGSGARRPTVAFIGWFGPRGLASLVFALLAAESGVPEGETVLTTVVVTVAFSITLHGLTSAPLVEVYHRWYDAHTATGSTPGESVPTRLPRHRRQFPGLNGAAENGDGDGALPPSAS
ncbi:cation:proton antiporter [Agromyces binzhouensis]|uniref:Sodium:proton antiporter n=1 Tax=Agromyces binzhouensis TaxID=1817495 RepID=A0A4Q2JYP8_9MICO|nr:cation:proton antiporter [Agromyces binzhouensis]RXZ51929.1 sodium:proton antiporter [Agromyces binzhouensis]